MEREFTGLTSQVWIVRQMTELNFELWVDIPGQRTYSLSQFMCRYLNKFFGETVNTTVFAVKEPRTVLLEFKDTPRGKEHAVLFKLGHEWL